MRHDGFPQTEYDVSIVVCTKDRAGLLDQMLGSLKQAADGIKYEMIVVEGGSSDNTQEVLHKHGITKVYSEAECLGPGRHSWPQLYNFGFSKARGKWAMYASDDILFSKECIVKAVKSLNSQKEEVAGGIFFYKNIHSEPGWDTFGVDFTYGSKLLMNYGLVRLDYFRQVGGMDQAYRFYCADGDLCLKLYESGRQFIPLPGCFIVHNNILDMQKKTGLDNSRSDIQLYTQRWKHFVSAEIPRPRRLLWQEDFVEAFSLPLDLEKIDRGIEYFWHGLACFQRGLFEQAKFRFLQTVKSSSCDHWQVLWYVAKAAYECGDKPLAEKAAGAVTELAPNFIEAKDLLQQIGCKPERQTKPRVGRIAGNQVKTIDNNSDVLRQIKKFGLWNEGKPLRLHLGCGEQHLEGYINIDFPLSEHTVQVSSGADVFGDVTKLDLPSRSVSEVRLHHLFEHFDRAVAMALLCKWHRWLKKDGLICIETPDVEAGGGLLSGQDLSYKQRQGVLRHIFGSHEAPWAIHKDGWYEAKFRHVLGTLGFKDMSFSRSVWQMTHNITVTARKAEDFNSEVLCTTAKKLLRDYMIDESATEEKTWAVWCKKFDEVFNSSCSERTCLVSAERGRTDGGRKSRRDDSQRAPTVSIFMAVRNGEKYLRETIESILSQTYGDFELIIVDDGSTDGTLEIARAYQQRDNRIKVVSVPHKGEVQARNEALRHVNPDSQYLLNHDGDDICLPRKLERLVEYLEEHPEIGIVGCFGEYFDDAGNCKGRPAIEHEPKRIRQTFGRVNSMINSASLFRHEVFAKIGGYREEFRSVDDYDFFARALIAGFELANIPEVLHRIRLHPESVGSTRAKTQKILANKIRENLNWSLSTSHTEKSSYPQLDGEETVIQQSVESHPKREHKENPTQELLGQDFVVSHNVNFRVAELLSADSHIAVSNRQDEIWNYLSKNPKDGFGHLWVGLILWWQGKYKEACKEFEMAESLGVPQWRTSWYRSLAIRDDSENWGWRNYELARKLVSKVLDAVPMFDGALTYQLYLNGYYSQWGQDTLVEDFFRFNKPRSRIFVDVGAYDGITLSNTKRLFDIGWSGVCIEPVSSNFQKLEALYAGTDVKCVQKAISFKEGVVNISVAGTGSAIVDKPGATTEQIRSCKLTEVLDQLHIRDVDFLSIDAEGVDFEVLQSLDFGRFRPQLIVIEYNSSKEEREQISAFMREIDYVLWHDNVQDVFFRTSETVEPPNFWFIKTLEPKRPDMRNSTGQKVDKRQVRTSHKSKSFSILHTVEFYSPHVGGAELVVQQLSERLVKRGHKVTVATTKLPERKFRELNGVAIEEFDVSGSLVKGFRGSDVARYQQFLLKHPADIMMNYAAQQWATDLAFEAMDSMGDKRVNIIAPCGYSALKDACTLRMKEYKDYFTRIVPTYLPKYDAAVYHSATYQDYQFAQNHNFTNSIIIPNGVCEEEFSQAPQVDFRRRYNITTKYFGLCVANFYPGKGQDKIIECVRRMNRPDFTVAFIGKQGGQLPMLRQLATGLNIRFCVGIDRRDVLAAYHQADIFLFASEKECSPLVILEAKASRLPFVSTDCGNVREWSGGVVCTPEKMSTYVNRILDDDEIRKTLGQEGWKQWKEKFTWESVVDRYEELYVSLYRKKRGAGAGRKRLISYAEMPQQSSGILPNRGTTAITALVFSKDRAMQLQATIESFLLHCRDQDSIDLVVLYKVSNELHGGQYTELKKKFPGIDFVEESNFREQVLSAIEKCDYILFLVDDNIFIKPFSMKDITEALQREKDAVGFSLRLGRNTNYCYAKDSKQTLPLFQQSRTGILTYNWTQAEFDFGYPLELSSSIYRTRDILRLLDKLEFDNPNVLEGQMAANAHLFAGQQSTLLCCENSLAFCNPINKVQAVWNNRCCSDNRYSADALAELFDKGVRIDVESYSHFIPNACHQEVQLYFKQAADLPHKKLISTAKSIAQYDNQPNVNAKPQFSIVMANYNRAGYIGQTIESVVHQTFKNWELIVVDDCSTDHSLDVITQYLSDKRIKLIQLKSNCGYATSMKTGITNVRSDYFGILHSDDCLLPQAVETMYEQHVKFSDCGLIYSQFAYCDENLNQKRIGFCREIPQGRSSLDVRVSHFITLKLCDYLKTTGYDENILYAEDIDIVYKMEEVTRLKFVDKCAYLYREWPNSISHSKSNSNVRIMSGVNARINALKRRCAASAASGRQTFEQMLRQAVKAARVNYKDVEQYFTMLRKSYEDGVFSDIELPPHIKSRDIDDKLLWIAVNVTTKSDRLFELLANQRKTEGQPLVSIYMVTYNAQQFIAQAVESVLAQTYKNFELLIVNDGSTDETGKIIASYSDERIRCIYKEHKNFASGMNRAIIEAKGEYIIGVDSDDFVDPDYVEKLVICAEKHPDVDYFYPATFVLVDESGNRTGVEWNYLDFSDNQILPAFLFDQGYGPIPNPGSLKRRSLFTEKCELYKELETVEDFTFLCRNALRINFKRVQDHSTYFYRRMASGNSQKFEARNQLMARALNDMVLTYPPQVLYPQIRYISPGLREKEYYKYLMTTFYKHSHGNMVQYGKYFRQYGDYYKAKLLSLEEKNKVAGSASALSDQEHFVELFKQGAEHLKAGQPADALVCFDGAYRLDGKVPALQYARAVALVQLGKWNDARLACEAELAIQPDHKGTQMLLERISENAIAIN